MSDKVSRRERVINVPPRGIGEKTVEAIREHARHAQVSMWESMNQLIAKGEAGQEWDGVRNHSAKLNLQAMKKGEPSGARP